MHLVGALQSAEPVANHPNMTSPDLNLFRAAPSFFATIDLEFDYSSLRSFLQF